MEENISVEICMIESHFFLERITTSHPTKATIEAHAQRTWVWHRAWSCALQSAWRGCCLFRSTFGQGSVLSAPRGAAEDPESPPAWLSFRCAVLVFDMPDINYQDRLFEPHKHLWMHMKWRRCKNFKLGFSSWNPSGWRASYVELMLLATFFTISHPIIIYILSYVIFPRPQPLWVMNTS